MIIFNGKNTLKYFLSYQSLSPLTCFLSRSNACGDFEVKTAGQKTIICDKEDNLCNSKNNVVYKKFFKTYSRNMKNVLNCQKYFYFN